MTKFDRVPKGQTKNSGCLLFCFVCLFFGWGGGGGFDPADFKLSVAVTVHARDKVMH